MKLWVVTIKREAVVMAKTERDALNQRREIERWEDYPTIEAKPFKKNPTGWDDDCLVYHSENEDITLKQAKEKCRA